MHRGGITEHSFHISRNAISPVSERTTVRSARIGMDALSSYCDAITGGIVPALMRVEIFDNAGLAGTPVFATETEVSGPRAIDWHGRDHEGNRVDDGLYHVRIATENLAGYGVVSTDEPGFANTIAVKTAVPDIALTGMGSNGTFAKDGETVFHASGATRVMANVTWSPFQPVDGSVVVELRTSRDGSVIEYADTLPVGDAASLTVPWGYIEEYQSGIYEFTAYYVDTLGYSGRLEHAAHAVVQGAEEVSRIFIDNSAPSLRIDVARNVFERAEQFDCYLFNSTYGEASREDYDYTYDLTVTTPSGEVRTISTGATFPADVERVTVGIAASVFGDDGTYTVKGLLEDNFGKVSDTAYAFFYLNDRPLEIGANIPTGPVNGNVYVTGSIGDPDITTTEPERAFERYIVLYKPGAAAPKVINWDGSGDGVLPYSDDGTPWEVKLVVRALDDPAGETYDTTLHVYRYSPSHERPELTSASIELVDPDTLYDQETDGATRGTADYYWRTRMVGKRLSGDPLEIEGDILVSGKQNVEVWKTRGESNQYSFGVKKMIRSLRSVKIAVTARYYYNYDEDGLKNGKPCNAEDGYRDYRDTFDLQLPTTGAEVAGSNVRRKYCDVRDDGETCESCFPLRRFTDDPKISVEGIFSGHGTGANDLSDYIQVSYVSSHENKGEHGSFDFGKLSYADYSIRASVRAEKVGDFQFQTTVTNPDGVYPNHYQPQLVDMTFTDFDQALYLAEPLIEYEYLFDEIPEAGQLVVENLHNTRVAEGRVRRIVIEYDHSDAHQHKAQFFHAGASSPDIVLPLEPWDADAITNGERFDITVRAYCDADTTRILHWPFPADTVPSLETEDGIPYNQIACKTSDDIDPRRINELEGKFDALQGMYRVADNSLITSVEHPELREGFAISVTPAMPNPYTVSLIPDIFDPAEYKDGETQRLILDSLVAVWDESGQGTPLPPGVTVDYDPQSRMLSINRDQGSLPRIAWSSADDPLLDGKAVDGYLAGREQFSRDGLWEVSEPVAIRDDYRDWTGIAPGQGESADLGTYAYTFWRADNGDMVRNEVIAYGDGNAHSEYTTDVPGQEHISLHYADGSANSDMRIHALDQFGADMFSVDHAPLPTPKRFVEFVGSISHAGSPDTTYSLDYYEVATRRWNPYGPIATVDAEGFWRVDSLPLVTEGRNFIFARVNIAGRERVLQTVVELDSTRPVLSGDFGPLYVSAATGGDYLFEVRSSEAGIVAAGMLNTADASPIEYPLVLEESAYSAVIPVSAANATEYTTRLAVRAVDRAGNASPPRYKRLILDNESPVISDALVTGRGRTSTASGSAAEVAAGDSGDIYDAGYYANHGTNYGSLDVGGLIANGQYFDGFNDHIMVPPDPSLNTPEEFTLSAWVKRERTDTEERFVSRTATDGGWSAGVGRNGAPLFTAHGAVMNDGPSIPDDSQWHHLAFVHDGTELVTYIDGNATDARYSQWSGAPQDAVLLLGKWIGNKHFRGTLDEVRISGRALSPSHIRLSYLTQVREQRVVQVPPRAPLVALSARTVTHIGVSIDERGRLAAGVEIQRADAEAGPGAWEQVAVLDAPAGVFNDTIGCSRSVTYRMRSLFGEAVSEWTNTLGASTIRCHTPRDLFAVTGVALDTDANPMERDSADITARFFAEPQGGVEFYREVFREPVHAGYYHVRFGVSNEMHDVLAGNETIYCEMEVDGVAQMPRILITAEGIESLSSRYKLYGASAPGGTVDAPVGAVYYATNDRRLYMKCGPGVEEWEAVGD